MNQWTTPMRWNRGKPRVGGGEGGATRTGSAFRIRRKLRPQPLQCTSRLLLHAQYTPVTTTASQPRAPRSDCTNVCRPARACLRHWPFSQLKSGWIDTLEGVVKKRNGWRRCPPPDRFSRFTSSPYTVHPWDILKKMRGKPNSAVIKRLFLRSQ